MIIGNPDVWADTFPDQLIPRILDLITTTWADLTHPGPADHEVPITQRFRHALKQAKDLQKLPLRIEREPAEDHPVMGIELGRIDLKFCPAMSALEEVYFAFECKRLNIIENGKRRTLASQYVTDGVARFVNGQYGISMKQGGMLGYVLDGKCDDAIRFVQNNIRKRSKQLQIVPPGRLRKSNLRPTNRLIRETDHNLGPSRIFRIHHLFLGCS